MSQSRITSATPASDSAPQLCSDCHEPAIAGYQWDWGQRGFACGTHQFLLRQRAGNLQRNIQFTALDPHATPALTRDERTQFHARVLTLEDELRDAKTRGVELYQSNTRIAEEARRLAARNREIEAQLIDARSALAHASSERDARAADLADAVEELGRLRAILPSSTAGGGGGGVFDASGHRVGELEPER